MKELTIQGKTLQYEVISDASEAGVSVYTEFYMGSYTETYRKYWFFGELITEVKPKHVFTIWRDIENKQYTKKSIRKLIEHELELLGRAEEIARGEII